MFEYMNIFTNISLVWSSNIRPHVEISVGLSSLRAHLALYVETSPLSLSKIKMPYLFSYIKKVIFCLPWSSSLLKCWRTKGCNGCGTVGAHLVSLARPDWPWRCSLTISGWSDCLCYSLTSYLLKRSAPVVLSRTPSRGIVNTHAEWKEVGEWIADWPSVC